MEPSVSVAAPASAGLWRHRDFLLFWTGQTISLLGSRVGGFALTFVAVLTLDATPLDIALINAAQYGPGLLIGLFAGVWVDRLRRRPVLIAADIGRALVMATVPLAALRGWLSIGHVLAVALAAGTLTVIFDVAYHAYIPTLVRRERVVEANSRLTASNAVTELGGWSIAGFLIAAFAAPLVVLADAASFLVSAVSLALIRAPEPPPVPAEARENILTELRGGLRLARVHPVIRSLICVTGVWNLFGSIFGAVIILFATRALGLSPAVQGSIYAAGGGSALVGAVLARRVTRRFGLRRTMRGALTLAVGVSILIPLASGPPALVIAFMLLPQLLGDGARAIYEIGQASLVQTRVPDRALGRVGATVRVVEGGTMLAGLLLGGVLGETIGLRPTLFVAVAGSCMAPLWLLRSPLPVDR